MFLKLITTKPGSRHGPSIKNPRVYDALRRQGMSKQQAAAISNAQLRKKKALPIVLKAPNYGARAGQTIAGRLVRGADGKFSSSGAAAPKRAMPRRGRKPAKTEAQRAAERQQRAAERQVAREQTRRDQRDQVLADLGIDAGAAEALVMLSNGEQPQPEALARMGAVEAGLAEQAKDGGYRLTPAGRQLLGAAERGDTGLAGDVISRARDRRSAEQEAAATPPKAGGGGGGKKPKEKPPKFPARQTSQGVKPVGGGGGGAAKPQPERAEAQPATDPALAELAQRLSAGEELSQEEQDTLIRNGLARLVRGELVLTMAGQRATRGKAFQVYKDARGKLRWVAYSSNAYRDRDAEIVSTKALVEDCARADAAKAYGPLRWWHVPGWELGECDFNAMHGRVLIESGTFKSDAIAQAIARKAGDLQLSIGFTHAPDEPDASGVFHHIRRFERSLVPGGRAANPFTRLIVKDTRMDTEKEAALKSLLGDGPAAEVIGGAEAVQKDADDKRTAFKSADPWDAVVAALKAALLPAAPEPEPEPEPVAEKAPPPMAEEAVEEVAEEPALVEEQAMDGGEMSADEFLAQIGALIDAKLAPIAGLLDIEKKVAGHVASLMQPYQAQKDASDAEKAAEIAALKERLAALEGDQPSAWKAPWGGYRASEDDATTTTKEQAEQLGLPPLDDDAEWTKLRNGLFGTTNGVTR